LRLIRFGELGKERPGLMKNGAIVDLRELFPEIPDIGPCVRWGHILIRALKSAFDIIYVKSRPWRIEFEKGECSCRTCLNFA